LSISLTRDGLGSLASEKKSNRSCRRYAYKEKYNNTVSATHTSKPDDFSKQNSNTLPQLNQWPCDSAVCVCVQWN